MQASIRDTIIWLNQLGILSDKITKLENYLGDIREIHNLDMDLIINSNILSKAMIISLKSSIQLLIQSYLPSFIFKIRSQWQLPH